MNKILLCAGTLLALTLLGAQVRAQSDYRPVLSTDAIDADAAPVVPNFSAEPGATEPLPPVLGDGDAQPSPCECDGCNACDACGDVSLRGRFARLFERSCDPPCLTCSPRVAGYVYSGVDSFRGITNGSYSNNNGVVNGFNLGGQLAPNRGIGWQAGLTYGVYNFSGRTSPGSQLNEATQQTFLTIGLFRRADANRRFSWGIVHDWMFSDNFGAFGNSPTLGQFRGQAAWALSAWNQVGLWATLEDRMATRSTGALGVPVAYQAIDQGNLFWDHQFGSFGATSRLYAGVPLNGRLQQSPAGFPVGGAGNTLGAFILGSNLNFPLSDRVATYVNVMYMKPSAHAGVQGGAYAAAQEFWNVAAGLAYSPGGNLRSKTIAGRSWMPYLPVANNSSFLVDASATE